MPMATLNEQHARLARFEGTWTGLERMHPSPWLPQGGECEGFMDFVVELDGFAVRQTYEQRRGGQSSFKGLGVLRWNGAEEEVEMHWFDAMDQGHEVFRGTWDGDVLQLTSQNPMGSARMTWAFGAPNRLTSRMEMSPDGEEWAPLFDGEYTRRG